MVRQPVAGLMLRCLRYRSFDWENLGARSGGIIPANVPKISGLPNVFGVKSEGKMWINRVFLVCGFLFLVL
jgi:hypothetical protein